MATDLCEWCGHAHPRAALCSKRPTWSRRGFLQLLGAAAIGAATDPRCLTAEHTVSFDLSPVHAAMLEAHLYAALTGNLRAAIELAVIKLEDEFIYGNPLALRPRGFLSAR
jgi:hypothetical protein